MVVKGSCSEKNPGRRGKNVPALRSRLLGIFRLFSSFPVLIEERCPSNQGSLPDSKHRRYWEFPFRPTRICGSAAAIDVSRNRRARDPVVVFRQPSTRAPFLFLAAP